MVAAIAVSLGQSLRVYFAQAEQIAELRVEIQQRHDEIADLEDQINRWQDPDYVRAMARERLGWVMPGETGYRVIGVDGEALGESDLLGTAEVSGMWWEKMWGSVAVADRPVEDEESSESPNPTDPTSPPESDDD